MQRKMDNNQTKKKHVVPMQVRFNDVDKFGHVNNTIYFQFYDTAKTAYLYDVCHGVDWTKKAIIVVHIDADFVAQVKGDSNIAVSTCVSKLGNKSLSLYQEVFDVDTQEVKSRCNSVMVAYDLEMQATIPLPQEWVDSIQSFEGRILR